MAASYEQRKLAEATRGMPEQFRNCSAVARALIDTGQRLVRPLALRPFCRPTDYELARRQSINTIRSLIRQWNSVNDGKLRADVIRAVAQLRRVESACKGCAGLNARNLAQGNTFVCKAAEMNTAPSSKAFRFRLNHAGQIIETN